MMKKIVTAFVLAIFAIALTGSVVLANYGSDNSLSGKVRKYGSTKPINKAKVRLYTTGGTKLDSDTTGNKGKYSFTGLSERKYVVRASASKYRNPKSKKGGSSVSKTVDVNGATTKNLYLKKK